MLSHLLLTLAVVVVWGTNFVVIRYGLDAFPPLLFATLRFAFSLLPWVLLVKRPAVPWRFLAGNGLFLGFGMFGLLFIAMREDITPGVASIMVQTQAFFTIALAMVFLREPAPLSGRGSGAVSGRTGGPVRQRGRLGHHARLASHSPAGCAGRWRTSRQARRQGRHAGLHGLVLAVRDPAAAGVQPVAGRMDAIGATLADASRRRGRQRQGVAIPFGYGAELAAARHPTAVIAPFSLLVPVVAMLSSVIVGRRCRSEGPAMVLLMADWR